MIYQPGDELIEHLSVLSTFDEEPKTKGEMIEMLLRECVERDGVPCVVIDGDVHCRGEK